MGDEKTQLECLLARQPLVLSSASIRPRPHGPPLFPSSPLLPAPPRTECSRHVTAHPALNPWPVSCSRASTQERPSTTASRPALSRPRCASSSLRPPPVLGGKLFLCGTPLFGSTGGPETCLQPAFSARDMQNSRSHQNNWTTVPLLCQWAQTCSLTTHPSELPPVPASAPPLLEDVTHRQQSRRAALPTVHGAHRPKRGRQR